MSETARNGPSRVLFVGSTATDSLASELENAHEPTSFALERAAAHASSDLLGALARSDAHVAVVDMTLDEMRGAEGWRRVRDGWDRPIIVVCAEGDASGMQRALADGAEEALRDRDPSAPVCLRRAISRALARKHDVRPEVRLRDLRARWNALDAASQWYVIEIDHDDRITYVNRAGAGTEHIEVCGKSVFEFTHPDAHADVRARLARVRSTGEALTIEERAHGTMGDDSWFVARLLPVKRDGRVASIIVITEDVSEHHRMQQRLVNSERRFRALIEKSTDAIVLLDAEGRSIYASPATARVLGFAPDEMPEQDLTSFVHPDDLPAVLEATRKLRAKPGSHAILDARLRHKDGTWRLAHGIGTNLLDDPAVGAVVGNYRDVTEERALEEQVRRAQRWEAIGLLAGGIAHDFNNLLCIIMAAASSASSRLRDAEDASALHDIRDAAAKAAELTRKLLTLGRKEPLAMRYVDAADLVTEFASLMRRSLGEDIELVVRCERPLPVRVDRLQIEQVLLNVCTNAKQAMQGRGRVRIEGRSREIGMERVIEIAVHDDGAGMDEETRRRVFDPFFTTKREGSGLGMTVSYGIVQRHGGSMSIESQPGQGTVVTFHLPEQEGPPPERAAGEPRPKATAAGATILVAEDEPPLRRIVCRILRAAGYDVVEAQDGEEATLKFEANPRAIDLVILDVRLPRLSGPAAYAQMIRQRARLPVLFVTGHAPDSEVIPRGSPLLVKPFANDALLRAVVEATAIA